MVSRTFSYLSRIWGIISGVFIILITLFQDEIKNLITSIFGVSNKTFVFYTIIGLLVFGILSSIIVLIYGWKTKPNRINRNLSYFIDQTISTLRSNITYEEFRFSDGFNSWFSISTNDGTLNDFSRLKPWLGWKIKRYNKFCNQIDTMVRNLREKAREQEIVHSIHTPDGQEYVLKDEYERYSKEQIDVLLENRGLYRDKELIEQSLKKLSNKSTKLLPKFQSLRLNEEEI